MCGIIGILDTSPLTKKLSKFLYNCIDLLKHRGPDMNNSFISETDSIALGHTRLSILDLSHKGKQPMTYRNRWTLTYNGEIYNFIELRKKLKSKGHTFISDTDSEVVLVAFAEWGPKCVEKFNGMWAFAIWDNQKKSLFLSRDRFGVKPLYYQFQKEKSFIFASEIYALKFSPSASLSLSSEIILALLHEPNSIDFYGLTPYRELFLLPAGHSMIVSKDLKEVQISKWWKLTQDTVEDSDSDIEESFENLLSEACAIRLRSDVSLATGLSGGLDSSSIYASLHNLNNSLDHKLPPGDWHKCFSLSFPGSLDDESYFAFQASNYFNSKCNVIKFSDHNIFDKIRSTTCHYADFSSNPICSLTPIYKEIANDDIKVSIDGHGGDECLMGYPDMIAAAIEISPLEEKRNLQLTLNEMLRNPVYSDKHHIPISAKARIALGKVKRLCGFGPRPKPSSPIDQIPGCTFRKQDFRVPDLVNDYRERKREMKKSLFGIHRAAIELERLPLILRNFDKASMLSGVEIRAPFLDYRLVEFCCNLPLRHKVRNGYTKYILRKIMDQHLPREITWRKHKIGINAPLDLWMQNQSFVDNCKEQLDGNASWISEMLEITKPTESLFDATKQDTSLNWFLLNLSFLKTF